MPRFAQLDGSIVTGTLIADAAPTELPAGRTFVALADDAVVKGGETYNTKDQTFTAMPPAPLLPSVHDDLQAIKAKLGI